MDLFSLRAVLGLDTHEYEEGIKGAVEKANVFSDVLKANLVTKGIEVAAKGMMSLGKAAIDLVEKSVASYADYEQLVGGVETLFKGSAETVKRYAEEAYKSAGLSANEYMETVTGFSASLIQSLSGDTQAAARLANVAIQDMSDNANKMGSDMASIQNAYQGFAKQNYTMLDNLKLGYGGTKEEMERLIADAMKLDSSFKVAYKTSDSSKKNNKELAYTYADIVKAIHIVQTEMGITGTTAKEAEHTIAGSLNMVKASWKNLLTGIGQGDGGNIDKLVDQLVYSVEKAGVNLMPVIEKAIYGITHVIEALGPVIADRLPAILDSILPSLTKATAVLITTFAKALISNMPIIISAAKQVLAAVFEAISSESPGLMAVLLGVGGVKAASTIKSLTDTIKGLVLSLTEVEAAGASASGAISGSAGAMSEAAAAGSGLAGILAGVATAALGVADAILVAYDVKTLKDAYDGYKEAGDAYMAERNQALALYQSLVQEKGIEIANQWAMAVYGVDNLTSDMARNQELILSEIEKQWDDVPKNIWDGFKQGWDSYFGADGKGLLALLGDAFTNAVNGVKGLLGISSPSTVFENIGINIMQGLYNGIMSLRDKVIGVIQDIASRVANAVKGFFRINSPSGLMQDYGRYIVEGLAQGITSNSGRPLEAMKSINAGIVDNNINSGNSAIKNSRRGEMEYTVPRSSPAPKNIVIKLMMDGREFAQAAFPYLQDEEQRVGMSLATR